MAWLPAKGSIARRRRACVWMGLKWEKRYSASNAGQSSADSGSGSRSSSSVCGGCRSGRIRPLKEIASSASAPSQSSEMALRRHAQLKLRCWWHMMDHLSMRAMYARTGCSTARAAAQRWGW